MLDRMATTGARVTTAAVVALALTGCSGVDRPGLRSVEDELSAKYLQPLTDAGLSYEVEDTCRLALQPADTAWHLVATFAVDAELRDVARVLREEGIRLEGERDPVIVQQEPGDPSGGWNGGLRDGEDGTLLELTFNNVGVEDLPASGGWGEPCAL